LRTVAEFITEPLCWFYWYLKKKRKEKTELTKQNPVVYLFELPNMHMPKVIANVVIPVINGGNG